MEIDSGKEVKKPPLPGPFKLTVEARCIWGRKYAGPYKVHFKFDDTMAKVSLDGKELGSIAGCVGGGVEISDAETGDIFYITPQSIWKAYEEYKQKEGN
jgi:hypothetical protein